MADDDRKYSESARVALSSPSNGGQGDDDRCERYGRSDSHVANV